MYESKLKAWNDITGFCRQILNSATGRAGHTRTVVEKMPVDALSWRRDRARELLSGDHLAAAEAILDAAQQLMAAAEYQVSEGEQKRALAGALDAADRMTPPED